MSIDGRKFFDEDARLYLNKPKSGKTKINPSANHKLHHILNNGLYKNSIDMNFIIDQIKNNPSFDIASVVEEVNINVMFVEYMIVDVRHIIENCRFNVVQGYKLSKSLQHLYNLRRQLKDDHMVLVKIRKLSEEEVDIETIIEDVNKMQIKLEEKRKEFKLSRKTYKSRILDLRKVNMDNILSVITEILK